MLAVAGTIYIPKAVDAEMAQHETLWMSERPAWIEVKAITQPYATEAIAWQQVGMLDPGEAEAIALARYLKPDWLLTDDAAARLLGQSLGLEVHGSLGIVLWAAATGHLKRSEADAILDRLKIRPYGFLPVSLPRQGQCLISCFLKQKTFFSLFLPHICSSMISPSVALRHPLLYIFIQ